MQLHNAEALISSKPPRFLTFCPFVKGFIIFNNYGNQIVAPSVATYRVTLILAQQQASLFWQYRPNEIFSKRLRPKIAHYCSYLESVQERFSWLLFQTSSSQTIPKQQIWGSIHNHTNLSALQHSLHTKEKHLSKYYLYDVRGDHAGDSITMLQCLKILIFDAKVKSFDFQVRNDLYHEEALLLALELLWIWKAMQVSPLFSIICSTNKNHNYDLSVKRRDPYSLWHMFALFRSRQNYWQSSSFVGEAHVLKH